MNEDVITDLKQFITATVSQQTVELGERIERVENRLGNVEGRLEKVEEKIDGLTEFVTEAIDTSNEEHGKQYKNHERRITKLEHVHSN